MNREIHSLLKTRHAAFKSDDPDLYSKSRYDLCKTIRDAERQYWIKSEAQTDHSDSCSLCPRCTCAHCHRCRHQIGLPGSQPKENDGPGLSPRRARRSCVDQLVEVFIDIFNLSLLQAEDPTCFKKTTIIP
eukprot:g46600.t1